MCEILPLAYRVVVTFAFLSEDNVGANEWLALKPEISLLHVREQRHPAALTYSLSYKWIFKLKIPPRMSKYSTERCVPTKYCRVFIRTIQGSDDISRYWEPSILSGCNDPVVCFSELVFRQVLQGIIPDIHLNFRYLYLTECLRQ